MYDRYWDGQGWHGWEPLGAPERMTLVGQPAAAARGADRIDVMAFGSDGSLWHRWWDGKRWVPWQRVEGAPPGDAVSCSWVGDRLDVYVRGDSGVLWYRALGLGA